MKFKFAKDVKESTERKESRSFAFLLFLISIMCCAWIAPSYLFADLAVTIPGGTIPPELWEKNQPTKKPPLPSQMYGLSPDPAKILHLPPIDIDSLIEEDKLAGKDRPLRAGIHREVDISPQTHGEWWDAGKGSIWLFELDAPSAVGIRVYFTDVNLPRGARIYVYSPSNPDKYEGPYKGGPELVSGIIWDNKVIIELDIPIPYDRSTVLFNIGKISHIYRPVGQRSMYESKIVPLAGTCYNDPTCSPYSAWAQDGDAVGRLVFDVGGQTAYCTGTIIDDLAQDRSPYLLTANHCIDESTDTSKILTYWFYETSTCNGTPPVLSNMDKSEDAVYLEGKTDMDFSDFTLLELLGSVPRNLSWASTTTVEPSAGDSVAGIHHPDVPPDDYRRISFGNTTNSSDPSFLNILWYSGSTEPGSSGSCIWNSDHQCVGTLSSGSASCNNPSGIDDYGKFSVSYPFIRGYLQEGSDDALEDNDSRSTAGTIQAGAYKGNVVKLSDEDWYKITVPSDTRIAVDVSFVNNHGDINIELYRDADATPVVSSTGTGDSEHVEYVNSINETDYFVRVFLDNDTRNSYNMVVKTGPDDDSRWIKNYGFFDGTAYDMQPTADGGYVVAGEIYFGNLWVLKLDAAGDIQWEKAYDNGGFESAASIHQTSDGGYLVAGDTDAAYPSYPNIWLLKLDQQGNIEWQKTYQYGAIADYAESVRQTSDGGYIALGTTYPAPGKGDIWILKLDSSGGIQWQKTYGGGEDDGGESIRQTSDGGYIVAGYTFSFGSGHADFWLLKTDANGSLQWQKTYGGSSNQEVAHSAQETADGGYIVAGETYSFGGGSSDFWVLKIDAGGGVQWQKSFGSTNGDMAYSIRQTSDGGYIVAGETYSFSAYNYDALVLKLDSGGAIEWQHAYGGGDDDGIYSIHQEPDGGYIAAGYTYSFSTGYAWVLKLDGGGNIDSCTPVKPSTAAAYSTSATITNTGASIMTTSISPSVSSASVMDTAVNTTEVCMAANPSPEIFAYPAFLDFGYENPGQQETRKIRIRNMGTANLAVTPITINGTDAGEFSLGQNNCTSVPSAGSCTLDVTFAPISPSPKAANLSISSDDPNTATLDIPLSGISGTILVVTRGGEGAGTVTSSPGGISCGNDCIEAYGASTIITLTATPDPDSVFTGWSGGGCSGQGTCTITLNSNTTVTASFGLLSLMDKIGVYRSGAWYLDLNGNRTWDGTPTDSLAVFSVSGVIGAPVTGDWNGDGTTEIGIYDDGDWYLDYNGNGAWDGAGGGDIVLTFGISGDIPVPGDWNGDGVTEVGIKREPNVWYLDINGNGQYDNVYPELFFNYGIAGDVPITGDWNGDGVTEIGVQRGQVWYLDINGNRQYDNTYPELYFHYGIPGDVPVTGDWNGDGITEIGAQRGFVWYLDLNGNKQYDNTYPELYFHYGITGDVPVSGSW